MRLSKVFIYTGFATSATMLGVMTMPAEAFTISSTSASWDNALLKNGTLVGSDGVAPDADNKVEFLDVDGESQVRWGSPVYGGYYETITREETYTDREKVCTKWKRGKCDKYEWEDVTKTRLVEEEVWIDPTFVNKSGLGFAGVNGLDISVGQVFNLGTLKHFNETIWGDGLAGTKVDFSLALDFGIPEIGARNFNFSLNIDETSNDASNHAGGVCPYQTDAGKGCSDKITWDFALDETSKFNYNGNEYTLELVGFSQAQLQNAQWTTEFISQEGGTSEAGLFARIVKVNTPTTESVPEPSGVMGLGLAAGAMVLAAKRRSKEPVNA